MLESKEEKTKRRRESERITLERCLLYQTLIIKIFSQAFQIFTCWMAILEKNDLSLA